MKSLTLMVGETGALLPGIGYYLRSKRYKINMLLPRKYEIENDCGLFGRVIYIDVIIVMFVAIDVLLMTVRWWFTYRVKSDVRWTLYCSCKYTVILNMYWSVCDTQLQDMCLTWDNQSLNSRRIERKPWLSWPYLNKNWLRIVRITTSPLCYYCCWHVRPLCCLLNCVFRPQWIVKFHGTKLHLLYSLFLVMKIMYIWAICERLDLIM